MSPKESSQRKRYTEEQGCRMLDWVNMTTTNCDGAVKHRERERERERERGGERERERGRERESLFFLKKK